jgi:molecular chaperone HscB
VYAPVKSSAAPRIAPLCSILDGLGHSIAAADSDPAREPIRAMIDFSRNYFDLFGLPVRFQFDPATLDAAYRSLQREVHPDRFAAAGDAERRLALQSSARVNEAYRALKDPVARARYLLTLHGAGVDDETNTALPAEFLERQLERREAVSDALAARDAKALAALRASVDDETAREQQRVATLLDGDGDWNAARVAVRELTFLAKLAADIDAMQAGLDD